MAGTWISIIFTAALWLISLAVMWGRWSAKMENLDESLKKYAGFHSQHFDSIRVLESISAALTQQLKDHASNDIVLTQRIETMFAETRQDIKEILKTINK